MKKPMQQTGPEQKKTVSLDEFDAIATNLRTRQGQMNAYNMAFDNGIITDERIQTAEAREANRDFKGAAQLYMELDYPKKALENAKACVETGYPIEGAKIMIELGYSRTARRLAEELSRQHKSRDAGLIYIELNDKQKARSEAKLCAENRDYIGQARILVKIGKSTEVKRVVAELLGAEQYENAAEILMLLGNNKEVGAIAYKLEQEKRFDTAAKIREVQGENECAGTDYEAAGDFTNAARLYDITGYQEAAEACRNILNLLKMAREESKEG